MNEELRKENVNQLTSKELITKIKDPKTAHILSESSNSFKNMFETKKKEVQQK